MFSSACRSYGIGLVSSPRVDAAVRALFAAGQQGFYFDPSDPSTAFQDSAGTTAGVVGQPVGLRLDKRVGTVDTAPNVNNSFDTAVWTKTAGTGGAAWVVTASTASVDNSAGSTNATMQIAAAAANYPTASGYLYRWRIVVVAITGACTAFADGTASKTLTVGTNVIHGTGLTGFIRAPAGGSITVGSCTIERVYGNHSTQGTSASRPVWTQDGSSFYRDTFDGFDDSLTIAAGGGSTTGFFYCAAINVAGGAGTARTIVSDAGANIGYRLRINAANQLELAAGNGVAFTTIATVATLSVGSSYVVTAWDDGVNLNVQVNQGAVASVARPVVSAGTATMTEGKDNGAASSFANVGLYSRIYRSGTSPDANQRAQIQRFNASRAGVAL